MKKTLIHSLRIVIVAALSVSFIGYLKKDESLKILLVGRSTTIGTMPREVNLEGQHLEHMMTELTTIEGLPILDVVNAAKGGETARRLLGNY